MHAYWRLAHALPSQQTINGNVVEPIERAHARLICRLGVDADGKPNVADPQCADRSRLMRLAGTVNSKSGQHARIIDADFQLAPYSIEQLVGDLPDPTPPRPAVNETRPSGPLVAHEDPYKRIAPPDYFHALAGIDVPAAGGLVRCPNPHHPDQHPSCSVGATAEQGWRCHAGSCVARGAIYDLASILLGGPAGPNLRSDAFRRAHAYVADIYGEHP